LDGVIVIDKPEGWTSHDVVNKVRRIAQTKKVGHLGTLDPIATGVLPLLLAPLIAMKLLALIAIGIYNLTRYFRS
jgi:tRNA pseudouridine55 synthase